MSLRRLVGPLSTLAALLSACGSSSPPALQPMSAGQLNAVALAPLEDDSLGAPRSTAIPAAAPTETPEPPPTASVRVIHASPDRAAASVDVYLGAGATTAAAAALAFRHAAGPVTVPVGEQAVAIRAAGAASDAAPLLAGNSPALEASQSYTVVALGLAGNAQTPLALAAAADDATAPESGQSRVRLLHAVAGLGAVDVCTAAAPARPAAAGRAATPAQPARAIFTNAVYGAFSDYVAVPAGAAVTLQLRVRNARPCAGLVRGTVTLTPAEGIATLVATGRVAPGPNNVPRVLLVCAQGGESAACAETPVR